MYINITNYQIILKASSKAIEAAGMLHCSVINYKYKPKQSAYL